MTCLSSMLPETFEQSKLTFYPNHWFFPGLRCHPFLRLRDSVQPADWQSSPWDRSPATQGKQRQAKHLQRSSQSYMLCPKGILSKRGKKSMFIINQERDSDLKDTQRDNQRVSSSNSTRIFFHEYLFDDSGLDTEWKLWELLVRVTKTYVEDAYLVSVRLHYC